MSLILTVSSKQKSTYEYFRINKFKLILEKINGKTIEEAAKELGINSISLLIFIGHLKKVKIIKEVKIV